MKRSRRNKGFTLTELLMAVLILSILFGIAFVAVNAYTRNLRLNEMDGTAKELFLSAQNQLSKAKGDGRLDKLRASLEPGKADLDLGVEGADGDYYIIYSDGSHITGKDAWNVILPFGAIDNTVRGGGSYIIQYNIKSAVVKGVFYKDVVSSNPGKFGTDLPLNDELKEIAADETATHGSRKDDRKNYGSDKKSIIGFWGGTDDGMSLVLAEVDKPKLTVTNAEELKAKVDVSGDDLLIILCVRGVTSKAEFTVSNLKTGDEFANAAREKTLDSVITQSKHFINVMKEGMIEGSAAFIPGEDIEVFVTVQKYGVLSNVTESDHIITNSLFGAISAINAATDPATAQIGNYRHLENLDSVISGRGVTVTKAEQTQEITVPNVTVTCHGSAETSGTGNFIPVNYDAILTYDGKGFAVDSVSVNTSTRHGGLFGNVANLTVQDLVLRNPNISSSFGASGALAGSATALNATNVLAYNSTEIHGGTGSFAVSSTGGAAGGLIGSMQGGTVKNCAAAVYVQGSSNAGGLIGSANNTAITNCYTGAHTGTDEKHPAGGVFNNNETGAGRINVKATNGTAGGLVGTMSEGSITNSYATGSVSGNKVNPFVGSDEMIYWKIKEKGQEVNSSYYILPDTYTNCYAIGWVYDAADTEKPWKCPYFSNADLLEGGLLNITHPQPESDDDRYNYDIYWNKDILPTKYISELNPDYKGADGKAVWFLENHVGDWAYPDYNVNLINTR